MKGKMKEKMKRDRGEQFFFFRKMFQDPHTRQMKWLNMFRKKKKKLSDELFIHFSFECSESERVFNYLHDSNSNFRAGRIHSECVFRCTVRDFYAECSLICMCT